MSYAASRLSPDCSSVIRSVVLISYINAEQHTDSVSFVNADSHDLDTVEQQAKHVMRTIDVTMYASIVIRHAGLV